MTQQRGPFWALYTEFKAGRVSRREFIRQATALGVGLPITLFILNSVKVEGVHAQDAGAAKRPDAGTEGQTRGAGGEVKIIQWQGPTHLSLHVATGTKDQNAAALITEPLLNYLPDGTLIPTLAAEVPTVENGQLKEDLSGVTFKLKEGVLWSDGQPFTSADVQFTWQWVVNPENNSIDLTTFSVIENIETPDELTAVVTFKEPTASWYLPFTGTYLGAIYPKHVLESGPEAGVAFRTNPIGTGPYKVESFVEGDQVIYAINENYREPNKPFFSRVNLKGGGDAASAAQLVLQTGDYDIAWNLQVEVEILRDFEANGIGTIYVTPATNVERVQFNFSDPNDESMGERSHKDVPHPFFTDKNVRQAFSHCCDRETVANQFYLGGEQEPTGRNILTGLAAFESSTSTPGEFSLEKAAAALDAAGWTMDGDVRTKDGRELEVVYTTTINSVRQKTQAVLKQGLEQAGFKVRLNQVDSTTFFDSAAGNEQNASHFFWDLEMFTDGATNTFPLNYMQTWYGGTDNIPQKANNWSGNNYQRYVNPEYNALYEELASTTDMERAAELFIQLNDIVINEIVVVPLVSRAAERYAVVNTLNNDNVAANAFETLYWNIVNWNRVG
jgi:peptide/nickel transport system substrate-binding protein